MFLINSLKNLVLSDHLIEVDGQLLDAKERINQSESHLVLLKDKILFKSNEETIELNIDNNLKLNLINDSKLKLNQYLFISNDNLTQLTELLFKQKFIFLYSSEPTSDELSEFVRKQMISETKNNPSKNIKSDETKCDIKADKENIKNISKPANVDSVFSCKADLYLFEMSVAKFMLKSEQLIVNIVKQSDYNYWLQLSEDNEVLLSQPIESSMNAVFSNEYKSFIWNYFSDETYSYSLILNENYVDFKVLFTKLVYEIQNKQLFAKVKDEDTKYLHDIYNDPMDISEEGEKSKDSRSDESEDESEPEVLHTNFSKDENSQLAVAYKNDRSFVFRGDKIGVFTHSDDHSSTRLNHYTTINSVTRMDGKTFSPAKVMLHNQDTSLVMLDSENSESLYRMDLNVGKVVEEWNVKTPIRHINPSSKYSQMTPEQTFVGINKNSLFRIDPRTKELKAESKEYKTNNQFSVSTTTGSGLLAIGSDKGDIRLYNKLDKQAKTHLPGMGDPIVGMDVSEEGKYLLATCSNYILLIDTEVSEGGLYSGFTKSMGKHKPIPKRLQLLPEHVAYIGKVQFTPARFNVGGTEKTICTSTGEYLITWNFRRVKQGYRDYTIKKFGDKVMADGFLWGRDRVVVALPNDVTIGGRGESPGKVLTKPVMNLKSRSKIVNSPF